MKIKYTLAIFMGAFLPYLAYTMEDGKVDPKPAYDRQELNNIIQQAKACAQGISGRQIIQQYKADKAHQHEEKIQGLEKAYKDQNTILLRADCKPIAFGIYKRDLVETTVFAANIAADVLVYKKLQAIRLDHILDSITKNYAQFLDVLLKVKEDQEKWQKEYDDKNAVLKLLTNSKREKNVLLKPLREYLKKEHSYIFYNPFKQETIVPLLIKFLTEKLGNAAQDYLIVNYLPRDNQDWACAYERDENGQLQRVQPVLSLTSGLRFAKWILSLGTGIWFQGAASNIDNLGKLNKFCGWGLPKFLFSKPMQVGVELFIIGWSAKFFDAASTAIWVDYIINNQEDLLELLTEYKKEKESFQDETKVKALEKKIKNFVHKGHEPISFMPAKLLRQWWMVRNSSDTLSSLITFAPLVGFFGWKGYCFYKDCFGIPTANQTQA